MLLPFLNAGTGLGSFADEETTRGMRMLLFAFFPHMVPLRTVDRGSLSYQLACIRLGMLSLRDELRDHVQETLAAFSSKWYAKESRYFPVMILRQSQH